MRAIALMIAAVLTFGVASDAFGLDPCPHHGVPTVAGMHAAMSHHAATSRHGAMSHDRGSPHDAASSTRSDTHSKRDPQHGVCTCMGACATSVAVPVPTAPELSVVITPVSISLMVAPSMDAPPSLYLELLPYGIAPPRADILL